jgi:hypothetical protein
VRVRPGAPAGLWCNSSTSRCERDSPGANPGFLTNLNKANARRALKEIGLSASGFCSRSNPSPGTKISTPEFGCELFVAQGNDGTFCGGGNGKLFTAVHQFRWAVRCGFSHHQETERGCSSTATEQPGASPGDAGSRPAFLFPLHSTSCPSSFLRAVDSGLSGKSSPRTVSGFEPRAIGQPMDSQVAPCPHFFEVKLAAPCVPEKLPMLLGDPRPFGLSPCPHREWSS